MPLSTPGTEGQVRKMSVTLDMEMPAKCRFCPLVCHHYFDAFSGDNEAESSCLIASPKVGKDVIQDIDSRPDWCPMHEKEKCYQEISGNYFLCSECAEELLVNSPISPDGKYCPHCGREIVKVKEES